MEKKLVAVGCVAAKILMEFTDLRWRRTGLTLAVRRCEIVDLICRLLRATHPTTCEILDVIYRFEMATHRADSRGASL